MSIVNNGIRTGLVATRHQSTKDGFYSFKDYNPNKGREEYMITRTSLGVPEDVSPITFNGREIPERSSHVNHDIFYFDHDQPHVTVAGQTYLVNRSCFVRNSNRLGYDGWNLTEHDFNFVQIVTPGIQYVLSQYNNLQKMLELVRLVVGNGSQIKTVKGKVSSLFEKSILFQLKLKRNFDHNVRAQIVERDQEDYTISEVHLWVLLDHLNPESTEFQMVWEAFSKHIVHGFKPRFSWAHWFEYNHPCFALMKSIGFNSHTTPKWLVPPMITFVDPPPNDNSEDQHLQFNFMVEEAIQPLLGAHILNSMGNLNDHVTIPDSAKEGVDVVPISCPKSPDTFFKMYSSLGNVEGQPYNIKGEPCSFILTDVKSKNYTTHATIFFAQAPDLLDNVPPPFREFYPASRQSSWGSAHSMLNCIRGGRSARFSLLYREPEFVWDVVAPENNDVRIGHRIPNIWNPMLPQALHIGFTRCAASQIEAMLYNFTGTRHEDTENLTTDDLHDASVTLAKSFTVTTLEEWEDKHAAEVKLIQNIAD